MPDSALTALTPTDLPDHLIRLQTRLRKPINDPLPRRQMVPRPVNGEPIPWPDRRDDHRKAAVLLLLYPAAANDPSLNLVFIQRPEYDGTHGGQISLPGGRQEDNETLATTAMRETHEEVGVDPQQVIILGQMAQFYVYASNHDVHPFVGYCDHRPEFVPCQLEVAEIIEAPLNALLEPAARQYEVRDLKRWGATEVPYFAVGRHKIWGATAIMLAEFLHLLRETTDD